MNSADKALFGAWRKGRDARAQGEPRTACPYKDPRTYGGHVTWGRAFVRAWIDGWDGALRGYNNETERITPEESRGDSE